MRDLTRIDPHSRGASHLADAVIATLTAALGAFDGYTAEHSNETLALAEQVADRLGIDEVEAETVTLTAALHDVGKIGVPPHVLRKAGPLTDDERSVMERHPVIGERILREVPTLAPVASAIRHEHERWDGCGYPDGLAGESIPLASRIVLACDAWHAMTSDRPYRRAMSRDEATGELLRCSGSQFDPSVTTALLEVLETDRELEVAPAA
jgi:HD-GYP domain-containing protein (c-di-GMP phosphodiesterase class II)